MPTIAMYLAVALAVTIGGWLGVRSLEERGAAKIRAQVERQTMEAELAAHEHRMRAQQAIDAVQREKAAEVAAKETELGGLRHERAGDSDGDRIVFDERWASWVRGSRGKPGDRPVADQVSRDPASRNR